MLPTNTASKGDSVWSLVGRANFENNVAEFLKSKKLVERRTYDLEGAQIETGNGPVRLPLDIERQLADDFAFIAAFEEGADTVTAATVETLPNGMRITMAANEGVEPRVVDALNALLRDMEMCAAQNLSRAECSARALDTVIRLNQNRIYGRLGSRKYVLPHFRRYETPTPLIRDIKQVLETRIRTRNEEFRSLISEMNTIDQCFQRMESLEESQDLNCIKSLLEKIFNLTVDGVSLSSRLARSGINARHHNTKNIRQIMKIANYWRICDNMGCIARSYRSWCISMKLNTLEPYQKSMWHASPRFVHAEIQIIAHFELNQAETRPRVIGASKEACFLCDSFVLAHGWFRVSKAHRQLYDRWTVPDLAKYGVESRTRLRNALRQVHEDVNSARRSTYKGQLPNQSSINLTRAFIPAPSQLTIQSPTPTMVIEDAGTAMASNIIKADMSQNENDHQGVVVELVESSGLEHGTDIPIWLKQVTPPDADSVAGGSAVFEFLTQQQIQPRTATETSPNVAPKTTSPQVARRDAHTGTKGRMTRSSNWKSRRRMERQATRSSKRRSNVRLQVQEAFLVQAKSYKVRRGSLLLYDVTGRGGKKRTRNPRHRRNMRGNADSSIGRAIQAIIGGGTKRRKEGSRHNRQGVGRGRALGGMRKVFTRCAQAIKSVFCCATALRSSESPDDRRRKKRKSSG